MSTSVKQSSRTGAVARATQGATTRATLIAVACELYGKKGFQDTSLDEVVAKTKVTKGALYHHFQGKDDLFKAVYEQVQTEVSDKVVAEFLRPDPWDALQMGCELWIDAHLDPAVQRIAIRDARAVLGWEAVREVEARYWRGSLAWSAAPGDPAGTHRAIPASASQSHLDGRSNGSVFLRRRCGRPRGCTAEVSALISRLLSGLATPRERGALGEAQDSV